MADKYAFPTLLIAVSQDELRATLVKFGYDRGLPMRVGRESGDFGPPTPAVLIGSRALLSELRRDWQCDLLAFLCTESGDFETPIGAKGAEGRPGGEVWRIEHDLREIVARAQHSNELLVSSSCICVPPLDLDLGRRQAFVNGQPIKLRRAEFNVLQYLMSNTDRVISAQELVESVLFARGSGGSARTHVFELRRKLADVGCAGFIETVRGSGYRLRNPGQENSDVRTHLTNDMTLRSTN